MPPTRYGPMPYTAEGKAIAAALTVLQPAVAPKFAWVGLYAQSDRNL